MDIQGNWNEVISEIEQAANVFIFHHTRPDGDCLGAAYGLKALLKLNFPDKNIYCLGDLDHQFPWMKFEQDQMEQIPKIHFKDQSLGLVVDANNLNRIDQGNLLIEAGFSKLARIDHHPVVADINYDAVYVDANKAACCEQIAYIAMQQNWKINPTIAQLLTLGILTDTGRFNYENVSVNTYTVMEWMLAQTNFDYFNLNLHLNQRSLDQIAFEAEVLEHYHLNHQVAYFHVTHVMMEQFHLSEAEASRVNIIANIGDCKVWLFFIDIDDQQMRVRLRSNSINVNKIAAQFQGGGHNMAAGCIIDKTQKDAVLAAINEAINCEQ